MFSSSAITPRGNVLGHHCAGGHHRQGQGEPSAALDDVTSGTWLGPDAVWADPGGEQCCRLVVSGVAARSATARASRTSRPLSVPLLVTITRQCPVPGRSSLTWSVVAALSSRMIIRPVGDETAEKSCTDLGMVRHVGGGHTEGLQKSAEDFGGCGRIAARPVSAQIGVELPVGVVRCDAVGPAQRQRGLAHAAHTRDHRDHRPRTAGGQQNVGAP
ncbi:hypothetical protein [Streptomyces sp. SAI-124]|uniref:hypothetical protein n=1 Tax=Streptomyces sp. SAI-124 TaxID=3377730 RepID=UPI003C7C9DD2